MLSILSITAALASEADLLKSIQHWAALDGGMIVVGVSTEKAFMGFKRSVKIDPGLQVKLAMLDYRRPAKQEMKKAMAVLGSRCGLHITDSKDQYKVMAYGICGLKERKLVVEETDQDWWVADQRKKRVRALDYAILTNDIDLQAQIRMEQHKSYRLQQGLVLGSGLTALSAFIPLLGLQEGYSNHTENRLWTSVFLLSTSAMLYYASAAPSLSFTEQQMTIKNYADKDKAKQKLAINAPVDEDKTIKPERNQPVSPNAQPATDETPVNKENTVDVKDSQ